MKRLQCLNMLHQIVDKTINIIRCSIIANDEMTCIKRADQLHTPTLIHFSHNQYLSHSH